MSSLTLDNLRGWRKRGQGYLGPNYEPVPYKRKFFDLVKDDVKAQNEIKRQIQTDLKKSTQFQLDEYAGRGECAMCTKKIGRRRAIVSVCHQLCFNQEAYCSLACQARHQIQLNNGCMQAQYHLNTISGPNSGPDGVLSKKTLTKGQAIRNLNPIINYPKIVVERCRDPNKNKHYMPCVGCHQICGKDVNFTSDATVLQLNGLEQSVSARIEPGSENLCKRCNWPICNLSCGKGPMHQSECSFLARLRKADGRIPVDVSPRTAYYLLGVIRVVLQLKNNEPAKYEEFLNLKPRRLTEDEDAIFVSVLSTWEDYWDLLKLEKNEVMNILMRLLAFKLDHQYMYPRGQRYDYGVYPIALRLSCEANSMLMWKGEILRHFCTSDIKESDEITIGFLRDEVDNLPASCSSFETRCLLPGINGKRNVKCNCDVCTVEDTFTVLLLYQRRCKSKCRNTSAPKRITLTNKTFLIWEVDVDRKKKDHGECNTCKELRKMSESEEDFKAAYIRKLTRNELYLEEKLNHYYRNVAPNVSIDKFTKCLEKWGQKEAWAPPRWIINRVSWMRVVRIAAFIYQVGSEGPNARPLIEVKKIKEFKGYLTFCEKTLKACSKNSNANDSYKRYIMFVRDLLWMSECRVVTERQFEQHLTCLEASFLDMWGCSIFSRDCSLRYTRMKTIISKKRNLVTDELLAID